MLRSALHLPNFRWLWLGQTFILCASQFWFVALTWLVLQKTGSGFAIGTVLMAAAIPRGLFMLVGGAISDRLPTHAVAAIAASTNTILIGLVAVMLLGETLGLDGSSCDRTNGNRRWNCWRTGTYLVATTNGNVYAGTHDEFGDVCGDRARPIFSSNFGNVAGNQLNWLVCSSRSLNASHCLSFIAEKI